MGFNFWRNFRDIAHNIPIPGVGLSINDAKMIYSGIEDMPGGTLIYKAPTAGQEEAAREERVLIQQVEIQKSKFWLYAIVAVVILLLLRK